MKGGFNFSSGLGSFSKKVSELTLSGNSNANSSNDISNLQSIFDEITLQLPQYHSGVVFALCQNYVSTTALYKDIKFSWYRSGFKRDELELLDDGNNRPFYLPSCDDIGFKICVQCEDIHEKGYNRYREVCCVSAIVVYIMISNMMYIYAYLVGCNYCGSLVLHCYRSIINNIIL